MQYLKAVVGAAVAGLGTLLTALADDRVTMSEWVGVAIATLVALGAVWAVPNRAAAPSLARHAVAGPNGPTTRTNGGTGSNVRVVPREAVRPSPPESGGYQGGDVAPPD